MKESAERSINGSLPEWVRQALQIIAEENPGCNVKARPTKSGGFEFVVLKPGEAGVKYSFVRHS